MTKKDSAGFYTPMDIAPGEYSPMKAVSADVYVILRHWVDYREWCENTKQRCSFDMFMDYLVERRNQDEL